MPRSLVADPPGIPNPRAAEAGVAGNPNWPAEAEIRIDGTLYASVSDAFAAYSAGKQMLVGPDDHTCNDLTLSANAFLRGGGREESRLLTTLNASDRCLGVIGTLAAEDVSVEINNTYDGITTGLNVTAAAVLQHVRATAVNAETTANAGSRGLQTNDDATLIGVEATGTTAGTQLSAGLHCAGTSKTVMVYGGKYEGTDYDIYNGGTTLTLLLVGPHLVNGTVFGDWVGYYYDENGDVVVGVASESKSPTTDVMRLAGGSASDFVATIATLPGGATLTYNAPSAGDEANLVPFATNHIAKLVLHNTTRSNNALINNCVTGTNTITLTATVPGDWQVGDTITIRSQTNTSNPVAGVYFTDVQFVSALDSYVRFVQLFISFRDTGAASVLIWLHPFEANTTSKRRAARTQVGNVFLDWTSPTIPIISDTFCLAWNASGTGTMDYIIRMTGEN